MISNQTVVQNIPISSLVPPSLTPQNLVSVVNKKLSFRKGGVRLEHEEINGKHIFHNYGHGSGGVALAYGTAFLSTKKFDCKIDQTKQNACAILGSGLIALLTAVELTKKGQLVTVYSNGFTKSGENNNNEKIVNQVHEGLFLPFGYDNSDKLQYDLITKISHDYYKQCIKANRYQSFKASYVYQRDSTIAQLKQKIPGFINNSYTNEKVSFGNGISSDFIRMKTIKIDIEMFLEELKVEATLRGAKFVEKSFSSVQQIVALNESAIFNCTSQTSREIFKDSSMTTKSDNLAVFKNPSQLEYSMSAQISENLIMRIHCFGDKIVLRNEAVNKSEDCSVDQMINQARLFFANKVIHPKL